MSKIRLVLTVRDEKTGKIELIKECRSWNIAGMAWWCAVNILQQVQTTTTYKDTSNADRNFKATSMGAPYWGPAPAGAVTRGIVVGSSNAAEAVTNYHLGTLIAHGTGANQLSYSSGAITEPAVSGTTSTFAVSRTVTNNSPTNPITVEEVGIYTVDSNGYVWCLARDVTGGTSIANGGGAKTFTYTVTLDNTS